MIRVLFSAKPERWDEYRGPLGDALDAVGLAVDLAPDHAPETVDYIVFAPNGPVTDFRPFSRCKAVLGLWAGVETVVGNDTLTQPLARMVDPGLTDGMVEWVTGHVLRHHLGIDTDIHGQGDGWQPRSVPLARDRRVGILGLGALGAACAKALTALNFDVAGWSRSAKSIDGVRTFKSDDGLARTLAHAEILVLLLPQTSATDNILNAEALSLLPRGAVIVNPGRGPLIDDDALLAALDRGDIAHATLDVFRIEPLPRDHAFWSHPKVTVTPHIASTTRAGTASRTIAENIARCEAGRPMLYLVDRKAGY